MAIKDIGIGIIGCGRIARGVHLPAYRTAGYKVVAAAEVRQDALDEVRSTFNIPHLYTDYQELLKRDDVQVVDVAVPSPQHVEVATEVVKAGKHAWVQKPFSYSLAGVRKLVALAKRRGVILGVNQNSNWAPGFVVAKKFLDAGFIGEPFLCTIENRNLVDITDRYYKDLDRFVIIEMAIHHIDLVRHWFGDPAYVYATATKDPVQAMKGEKSAFITLEYKSAMRVLLIEDWSMRGSKEDAHPMEKIVVDGTKGRIVAKSEWVEVYSERLPSPPTGTAKGVFRPAVQGKWFPDAFGASMGEMLSAVAEGRQPLTSGADNIRSLQVVFAAYKSIEQKRAVRPSEIQG
jgi:predicted dehydrogenase